MRTTAPDSSRTSTVNVAGARMVQVIFVDGISVSASCGKNWAGVRTAYTEKALPAGAAAWRWNGKRDDGTFAPRGRYRIVVRSTNGEQQTSQSVWVLADAFKLTTSVTTATRGKALTITARRTEALSTTPVLVIYQPGIPYRTVKMTKATSTTWTAKLTPRISAGAGTLTLKVKAKDSLGG